MGLYTLSYVLISMTNIGSDVGDDGSRILTKRLSSVFALL